MNKKHIKKKMARSCVDKLKDITGQLIGNKKYGSVAWRKIC